MGRKRFAVAICVMTLLLAAVGGYGYVLEQEEPDAGEELGSAEEIEAAIAKSGEMSGNADGAEGSEEKEAQEAVVGESPESVTASAIEGDEETDEEAEESEEELDEDAPEPPPEFGFDLYHGEFVERILPWQDDEGIYYVFLPSYGKLSDLVLSADFPAKILFDGHRQMPGDRFGGIYFGKRYNIGVAGEQYQVTQIEFRRSSNVPTMHITAESEDYFDSDDKDQKEPMTVSLFDKNGERETSELAGTIKGHGNSTWEAAKKPYQIKLDEKESLLGMGSAKKWLLIANAYDATNLKNKIVLDLARKVFSDWSPEGEFVDVYLNGRYNGLYLLTEKIEVKENRLSKDCECLLEQETVKRAQDQGFVTDKGLSVEINYPENCSAREYAKITESVQRMEDALFAEDDSWQGHIDAKSWAGRYLIDEFSGNFDADKLSSYFYAKAEGDGYYYFYGGPVWDYDKAFMQEDDDGTPYLFAVAAEYRRRTMWTPYYRLLLQKDGFSKSVKKLYKKKLQKEIEALREDGLDELRGQIQVASENNFIRWQPFVPPVGYAHETLDGALQALYEYIDAKKELMDDKWIAGTPYYIVGIEPGVGAKMREYEVRAGEEFASFPDVRYYHIKNPVWYDRTAKEEQYTEPFVPTGDIYLLLKRNQVRGGR